MNTDPTLRRRISSFSVVASLFAVLLLVGCGSSKNVAAVEEVNDSLKDARSAVRQAEQRGARNNAPLELRSANQKIDAAEVALKRGDRNAALMLADEAEADAELAEITALSTKSQNAVKEIRESIKLMREEIQRYQRNN